MQLGMVGLGRMGANMVRRLLKAGHQCVVFDMSPKAVEELVKEKAVGASSLPDLREEAAEAARGLADGSGGGRGQDHRRPPARSRERRHPHRRRQFLLRGRHPPRQGTRAERDSLRGCGNQRRRLGPGARLLHDDRRRAGSGQHLDPIFATLAPGIGDIPRTPGREKARRHRRARLPALRAERRRPLRQDGSQRHRIRHHGRLRRRAGHLCATPTSASRSTRSTPRRRRCAIPSITSTTSTCPTSPRCGGAAA